MEGFPKGAILVSLGEIIGKGQKVGGGPILKLKAISIPETYTRYSYVAKEKQKNSL